MMKTRRLIIGVAAASGLAAAASGQFQTPTRLIALSDTPAPDSDGSTYRVFYTPTINASGDVAFMSIIDTTPGSPFTDLEEGVWATNAGTLELVQREGLVAPGTDGVPYFGFKQRVAMGDNGDVSFFGTVFVGDGTIDSTNDEGLWQGRAGTTMLLGRQGDAAPDVPGAVIAQVGEDFALIDNSRLVVQGRMVVGPGGVTTETERALWQQTASGLELVHREGDSAPGSTFTFGSFTELVGNSSGDFAFLGSAGTQAGIWRNTGGTTELVARSRLAAPGTNGQLFDQFSSGSIFYDDRFPMNESGAVAFKGRLSTLGSLSQAEDTGIWSDHGGELTLIARESQPAAGTDATFGDFRTRNLDMNDAGTIAFNTFLIGGTGGVGSNTAIYVGDRNGLDLLVREGDAAPGAPGANFLALTTSGNQTASEFQIGINNRSDIAFIADIRRPGFTRNSRGLWAYSALQDEIVPIVIEDGFFDISPAQDGSMFRVVTGISFDAETGFNNAGQLTFLLDFDDGSEGIFVTTIPAPGVLALGAAVGVLAARRRR
ncbi:MAG: choice-of-anchor tandem repeat NxxGxxAF-containing protein [Planctomycetota bacterium]